ncbi:MAG: helix-turn-helix domain-containing protein [Dissulfurimicrobium sp.]|uniref:helix-turn-helix domain-containing protein n=1 Tax=Dissulfurimicrobium sp. TaxID=2022436 RepID=UPI00404BA21B
MEIKIGERLKRLRLAGNLTQEELANRTNLTNGYISQLERDNTSPSLATLGDILEVLGISLADFLRRVCRTRQYLNIRTGNFLRIPRKRLELNSLYMPFRDKRGSQCS